MAEKKSVKGAVSQKKTTAKKENKVVNPIDNILDVKNNQNIVLFDENDVATEFEQVALIPYNEALYCILRPVEPFEGMEEDEGIVFAIMETEDKGQLYLDVVQDEETIDAIFDIYFELFEEAQGN